MHCIVGLSQNVFALNAGLKFCFKWGKTKARYWKNDFQSVDAEEACIPPQYFNSPSPSDSQAPLWARLVSELQPNLSLSLQPSSSHKTWPLLNTSNKRIIPTALAERSAFTATCACLTQNPSFQRGLINTSTALIHTIHTHTQRSPYPPSLANPQQLQTLFQIKQITLQCTLGSSLA